MAMSARQPRFSSKLGIETKSISGTVTLNGFGLGNAHVILSFPPGDDNLLLDDGLAEILLEDGWHLIQNGAEYITQSDGNFAIYGVLNGTYTLEVFKDSYGFTPSHYDIIVNNDNHPNQDFVAEQNLFTIFGTYQYSFDSEVLPEVNMCLELKRAVAVPTFNIIDHQFDTNGFWSVAFYGNEFVPIPKPSNTLLQLMSYPLGDVSGPYQMIKQMDHDKGPSAFANCIFDGRYHWLIPNSGNNYINRLDLKNYIALTSYPHFQSSGGWLAACVENDNLWMLPFDNLNIIKLNKTTGEVTTYPYAPDGGDTTTYFDDCVYDSANNCIWGCPSTALNFCKIDCVTGAITKILYTKIPYPTNTYTRHYRSVQIIGDYVYALPWLAPYIIRIHRTTNVLEQLHLLAGVEEFPYLGGAYDEQGFIWLSPDMASTIAKINVNTFNVQYIPFDRQGEYSNAVYDGLEHVYFGPRSDTRLMRVNINTNQVEQFETGLTGTDAKFSQIYLSPLKDSLYLIPGHPDGFVELQSSKLVKVKLFEVLDTQYTGNFPVGNINRGKYSFENVGASDYKIVLNTILSPYSDVSYVDAALPVFVDITVSQDVQQNIFGSRTVSTITGTIVG